MIANIELRTIGLSELEANAMSFRRLSLCLGVEIAKDAALPPEFVQSYIVEVRLRPEWIGAWAIFDGVLAGSGMFKSAPNAEGVVEIGYGVAPQYEGKGIGTAIAQNLIAQGRAKGARVVMAHTYPDGLASQRILEKCGFVYVRQEVEPDDGLVNRYEIALI